MNHAQCRVHGGNQMMSGEGGGLKTGEFFPCTNFNSLKFTCKEILIDV